MSIRHRCRWLVGFWPSTFLLLAGLRICACSDANISELSNASSAEVDVWTSGPELCKHGVGSVLELPDVPQHLFGSVKPQVYKVVIPADIVACLITLSISVPHIAALRATAPREDWKDRKRYTSIVAGVPVVLATSKLTAVLLPRIWRLIFLLSALYEVVAFWSFMSLIFNMIAGGDNFTLARVLHQLRKFGPSRMWASPPLGCCFRCCVTPQEVQGSDLRLIRILMLQFAVLLPAISFATLFESMESMEPAFAKVETLSLVMAMQGLFALLAASEEALEGKRSHAKFWTIKGTFIASTAALRIWSAQIHDDQKIGNLCYSHSAIASAWAGTTTALLAMPLAALSRYAYPPQELESDEQIMFSDRSGGQNFDGSMSGSDEENSSD